MSKNINMEEFCNLLTDSPNEAKNIFSYLVGNGPKTTNFGNGLYYLYQNFSEKIKNEKDLWKPIIFKYFMNYSITSINDDLFTEYKEYFSPNEIQSINKLNNINEKQIINNLRDFSNVLANDLRINSNFKKLDGALLLQKNLKLYQDEFLDLKKSKKLKLLDSFKSKNIFETMIYDYEFFQKFLNDFGIEEKKHFEYLNYFSPLNVTILLSDHNHKKFSEFYKNLSNEDKKLLFFKNCYDNSDYHATIPQLILSKMIENKPKEVLLYINLFENELKEYFTHMKISDDINDIKNWELLLNKQYSINGTYEVYALKNYIENNKFKEKSLPKDFIKFIKTKELSEKFENSMIINKKLNNKI